MLITIQYLYCPHTQRVSWHLTSERHHSQETHPTGSDSNCRQNTAPLLDLTKINKIQKFWHLVKQRTYAWRATFSGWKMDEVSWWLQQKQSFDHKTYMLMPTYNFWKNPTGGNLVMVKLTLHNPKVNFGFWKNWLFALKRPLVVRKQTCNPEVLCLTPAWSLLGGMSQWSQVQLACL